MCIVVRESYRCGGMRNSENERGRRESKPPHFDRLRWGKRERGSRGEMRRMRAKPEVLVVVGSEAGKGLMARELAGSVGPVRGRRLSSPAQDRCSGCAGNEQYSHTPAH